LDGKKGIIDIYYISDAECDGDSTIIVRFEIKNLTRSDYIMRDIKLVEINEKDKVIKTFDQKQKLKSIDGKLFYRIEKIYGEDGEFSFLIKRQSIQSVTLTYDKDRIVEIVKIKLDNVEFDTEKVSFNDIENNIAIQYFDENDNLVSIRIKPKQVEWEKVKTIVR